MHVLSFATINFSMQVSPLSFFPAVLPPLPPIEMAVMNLPTNAMLPRVKTSQKRGNLHCSRAEHAPVSSADTRRRARSAGWHAQAITANPFGRNAPTSQRGTRGTEGRPLPPFQMAVMRQPITTWHVAFHMQTLEIFFDYKTVFLTYHYTHFQHP